MPLVTFAPQLQRHVPCPPQQVPAGSLDTVLRAAFVAAPMIERYNADLGKTPSGRSSGRFGRVRGTATLAGTMTVTLINGFTPGPGNSFVILDAATITGTFTTINLPSIAPYTWTTAYDNAQGTLTILVAAPEILPPPSAN